jgi:sugar phosphate isomerase/epimerase
LKLSLSTASLYVYPFRWIFAIAQRAGFDGVELVISPEAEWRGGANVKKLAAEYGLEIFSVHPPLLQYLGWKYLYRSIAPYLDRAMRVTADLGAPIMVVHMPKAWDATAGVGREFVDRLVSERKNLDGSSLQIALENRPRFRARDAGLILTTPQELRGFADAHDFPLTLDTAHIGTFDLDLIESYDYFRGRLANVHLSDLRDVSPRVEAQPLLHSYVKQHQLPGAGKLPLRNFIAMLAREKYSGPMTFELSPTALNIWNPRAAEAKLKQCVEFVRASANLAKVGQSSS